MNKISLFLLSCVCLFSFGDKFLMPEEAFKPKVNLKSNMDIEVNISLGKDIYLYADKLKVELKNFKNINLGKVKYPKSVEHHGEQVYLSSPKFVVSLNNTKPNDEIEKIEFILSFQGCSEQGLCYEPITKKYNFDIDSSKLISKKSTVEKKVQSEKSGTDIIADTIRFQSLWVVLITFLGFGLLLSLTPCVFPMIPIISGMIISQGQGITTRRAFALSITYVLSMSAAYTIAGILAGLFGANLQSALQAPWVIYSFSAVFLILAMSMFGYFELKLPKTFINKISSSSKKSGYVGVAVMGFLSALIVGPCVAAPLAGALVYIGQTGDAVLGGLALFAMSIGMGAPLIAIGVSTGKFMPKPGEWMILINSIFGVMMLLVAIWMLQRVISFQTIMIFNSIVGIGFGVFLIFFNQKRNVIRITIAIVILVYSLAIFIGALSGSTNMLKPLSFLNNSNASVEKTSLKFIKVRSIEELDNVLVKNKNRKIMLDFYADWCTSCKELEDVTFSNDEVKQRMKDIVLIQADITLNGDKEKDLSKKYGVFGPPVIIFFAENSSVMKSKTLIGFVGPEKFLEHTRFLKSAD